MRNARLTIRTLFRFFRLVIRISQINVTDLMVTSELPILLTTLKEILWYRRWSPPSIRIFPTHADFFLQKCISNHETKQASKFQSVTSSNCFTIDVWTINCWLSTVYFLRTFLLFLYHILHKFCSVLTCDILGIGLL